jgi:hypothetical protein
MKRGCSRVAPILVIAAKAAVVSRTAAVPSEQFVISACTGMIGLVPPDRTSRSTATRMEA